MKRFTLWALTAVICFAMAAPAIAADWKMAHIRPAGSEIDKDLNWFADEVKKTSDGKITIKIFGSSQLGDYTVVQERIGLGSVEMSCQSVAANVDKKMMIGTLLYLTSNYKDAKALYGTGGKLSNYLTGLYKKQGIKVLGWWPMYFGGIGLIKEPVEPLNPAVSKGCKIRVPAMKTFEVMADKLGYQATPLPFSEFFTAAQTGMVDGIIGGGAENYYGSFKDIIKHYVPANTHFEIWPLLINEELYEKLPADQKKVIDVAAAEFENRRWIKAEADQKKYEDLLEEAGAKVYRPTPEDMAKYSALAREFVYPEFKKVIGEKAYNEIVKAIDLK